MITRMALLLNNSCATIEKTPSSRVRATTSKSNVCFLVLLCMTVYVSIVQAWYLSPTTAPKRISAFPEVAYFSTNTRMTVAATPKHPPNDNNDAKSLSTSALFSHDQSETTAVPLEYRSLSRSSSLSAASRELEKIPTLQTRPCRHRISSPPSPLKPKIVVLGATGRIGRRIVKRLLETKTDMTVVAFVKDYDKACEVLYDNDGVLVERETAKNGPRLELVVGNLVPREEVYGYTPRVSKGEESDSDEDEYDDDEEEWAPAKSAARFYGNLVKDYDFSSFLPDSNEALRSAIQGSTVIINAVGTIRPTNIWTDFLKAPWRIFRSPSKWCRDARHPYYVNYWVMKKVLGYAEEEQTKREAEWEEWKRGEEELERAALSRGRHYTSPDEDDDEEHDDFEWEDNERKRRAKEERKKMNKLGPAGQKIKIVRISDLGVTHPPWGLVTVLTNMGRSLVFRDQDACEKILEASSTVDTVVLRPGDLTDDVRNPATTSLQVCTSGCLPMPALVGRDDVAELTVAAAVTDFDCIASNASKVGLKSSSSSSRKIGNAKNLKKRNGYIDDSVTKKKKARHVTVAVRWASEHLVQGLKKDGMTNAQKCMNFVVKDMLKSEKRQKRKEEALTKSNPIRRYCSFAFSGMMKPRHRRTVKPYGIFVALPVYAILLSLIWSVMKRIPQSGALGAFVMIHSRRGIQILSKHLSVAIQQQCGRSA